MDSKPPRATWNWGQCPYLVDRERYKLWCAIGYAVEIGVYVKARSLAANWSMPAGTTESL
jgi:hypothetical protein